MSDPNEEIDRTMPSGPVDPGATAAPRPQGASSTSLKGAGIPLPNPFGRYRIDRQLGGGAMGAVYLAHDQQLDRKVALKVPRLGREEPELLERFLREARAAARLSHPNLCAVHDVGEIDGQHYLTMAYIEGISLGERLRGGPMPPVQAVALVRTLALALHEAHRMGIIHRDLKPANVMIDPRGQPVVVDFGLARQSSGETDPLTRAGVIMGTPAYMSPEQVEGDPAKMGPSCDIYSLGVILYELLGGRPPFAGSVASILGQIMSREPEQLRVLRPDLDPRLEAICLKAMNKHPADRFPSMAAFAQALEEVERAGPATTGGIGRAPDARPSPRSSIAIAVSASAAVVLVAVLWLASRPRPSERPAGITTVSRSPAAEAASPGSGDPAPPAATPGASPGGSPVATPGGSPVATPGGSPVATPGGSPVTTPGGSPATTADAAVNDAPPALRALVAQLDSPRQADRERAARGLAATREPAAAEILASRIGEDRPRGAFGHERDAFVEALKELSPARLPAALRRALDSRDPTTRRWAAENVLLIQDTAAAPALARRIATDEVYTALYTDKSPPLEALSVLAPERMAPALESALDSHAGEVRKWAAEQLAAHSCLTAVPRLEQRIAAESARWTIEQDREPALAALAVLGAERVGPALLAALRSPDPLVRQWAAERSAERKIAAAAPLLERRVSTDEVYAGVEHDKDPALAALAALQPDSVPRALVAALGSKHHEVRRWAAEELGKRKDPATAPALVSRIENDDGFHSIHEDKAPALEALEACAPDKVAPALQRASASKEKAVREWALAELARRGH